MKFLSVAGIAFATLAAVSVASPIPSSSEVAPIDKTLETTSVLIDRNVDEHKADSPKSVELDRRASGITAYGRVSSTGGAWLAGHVVADVVAQQVRTIIQQHWDQSHQLLNGWWMWTTTVALANGRHLYVTASIRDGYVLSAGQVASFSANAVSAAANSFSLLNYNILDAGDRGTNQWGFIRVLEQ